jgi:O-antigen/teichoic acid export membrane protein
MAPPGVLAAGLRRSFVALLAGDLAAKLLRFLAAVVLARALTLESFGLVNTAIAVSGVAAVLTTVGLADVGARDVAVAPAGTRAVASRVVTVRLIGAGVVLVAAVAAALLADPDYLGLVLAGGAMALAMAASADWVLRGLERMPRLAVCWVAGAATVAAGSLAVALADGGAAVALSAFAAGEVVLAATTWVAVGRSGWPRPTLDGAGAMIRRAWPVGAASVIVYAYYANVDTIILAATRSPAEAGLYSAPYRIFLMLNVVAIFAAYAAFPALSRAGHAEREPEARALLTTILELLLCYGLLVVGCVHLLGAEALGLLFGARFESMEATFALLSLAVAWYAVGYPAGYSLIAAGENKRFLAGAATAGGLNLALNLVLIPAHGPIGAAVATVVGFAAASVVWLHARGLLRGAGRPLVAALVAISGVVAVGDATDAYAAVGVVALAGSALGLALLARRRRSG